MKYCQLKFAQYDATSGSSKQFSHCIGDAQLHVLL